MATLKGRVVLGRYRVVRPLARGGMGIVYLGRVEGAAGFAKPVVIKSVLASFGGDLESEQLFAREARIVSNLHDPGIVAVIDFGKVDDSYVMVLEYVHGYHLGQWLRYVNRTRGPVPVQHALHVVLRVLDVLSFAHSVARPDGTMLGVVHRDISPANVLIDLQGHVKLSDFGIARTNDDEFKTQQGMFRGTLVFSPPEAFTGARPDARFDQYSAALVLYQLLTGVSPFKGEAPSETIVRILNLTPPRLAAARNDVPQAIDEAVARALEKEPERRYASVSEFANALRAGVTWSEHEAEASFAAQIKQDFSDDELPRCLAIESLAVRDAAWREAQASLEPPVALSSSPPRLASESAGVTTARLGPELDPVPPGAATSAAPKGKPASRLTFGLGAAAAVALAAALAVALRHPGEPPARVLVIEKQHDEVPIPIASALATTTPPPAVPSPLASAEPPPAVSAPAAKHAPVAAAAPSNRGADLARAFQRRGSEIQRCFQQSGSDTGSPPSVSVRFQIDTAGKVQRAQVTPSSIATTAAGACLLDVARSTQFGPQPEAVSFAIPISARVVRR